MEAPAVPDTRAFDPSGRLLTFLRGVLGADVRYAEPPTSFGQGFDTLIFGLRIEGAGVRDVWARPLVLRVYRTPAQDAKARAEAAVQQAVFQRGFPALQPLAVETSDGALGLPFMIMERVPGGTLLDRFRARPWQARRLFREMGRLHAALHGLSQPVALFDAHASPSVDHHIAALRLMVAASRLAGLDDVVAWLDQHADAVREEEPVLLHGDFHPLNILLAADGTPRVIDWSDAARGDPHADVARTTTLIWFAQIAASSTAERIVLKVLRGHLRRWYLQGYTAARRLDRRRLTYWEAAQGLRGTIQLMEVHSAPNDDPLSLAQRLPPELIAQARAYVDAKARAFESMHETT